MTVLLAAAAIFMTAGVYWFSKILYLKWYTPFTVPIVTSTIMIVTILLSAGVSYDAYMIGAQWIDELLGPAVVALAYPLYRQFFVLKKYFLSIMAGVFTGTAIGILSGIIFAVWLEAEPEILASLVPKSVTTPIAMDISTVLGGVPAITAVFVMVAGVGGAMFGPGLLRVCRIDHFIGKGIGLGSAAHGMGTSRALEIGEKEAAISSIAMTLSAIIASVLAPVLTAMFV